MSDGLLSIVLPADRYATVRTVVDCLRAQTARDRIELVLVVPSSQTDGVERTDMTAFASFQTVSVAEPPSMAAYRAAGVRAAGGDWIFIAETHAYPHPRMAEALLQAAQPSRDVIVPAFGNANPKGVASWAGFLLDYANWSDGQPEGEIGTSPLFNVVYRRAFLVGFGNRLETVLSHSDEIAVVLRASRRRIHFAPAARIDHLNLAVLSAFLGERFCGGRLIGANRGARWTWPRRLAYAFGSPFIPLVLLWRSAKGWRLAARRTHLPAGTMPAMVLGCGVKACGELLGYVAGAGSATTARMNEYELHKAAFVPKARPNGR